MPGENKSRFILNPTEPESPSFSDYTTTIFVEGKGIDPHEKKLQREWFARWFEQPEPPALLIRSVRHTERDKEYENAVKVINQAVSGFIEAQKEKSSQTPAEDVDIIRVEDLTIFDSIKLNPAKNVEIISLLGGLFSISSLLISLLLNVHILTPLFAIIFLVISLGLFGMAKIEQKKEQAGEKSKVR